MAGKCRAERRIGAGTLRNGLRVAGLFACGGREDVRWFALAWSHQADLRGYEKISARTTNGRKPTGNRELVQCRRQRALNRNRVAPERGV